MNHEKLMSKGRYIVDCCMKGIGRTVVLYTITQNQQVSHATNSNVLEPFHYMPVFPTREDALNFIKSHNYTITPVIEECVLMYEGEQ